MTYVIAEAGSCGDADLNKMLALIDDAKEVGADAVKFQWTSNANLMALQRGKAFENGYVEVYGRYLQWPIEWHAALEGACRELALEYLCTVYLADDVQVVEPYVKHFKVASFEATDCEFIRAHAPFVSPERDVLISTGMCSAQELEFLVKTCLQPFNMLEHTKLLHCTSAYPAPLNELNLAAIHATGNLWKIVGYSDHSMPQHTSTGALAVMAGAQYLEAHLRLDDTNLANPDRNHAMTVKQFKSYVDRVREAESILGSGVKEAQPCEKIMEQYRVRS